MAKRVKSYKGMIIKETTPRDCCGFSHLVFTKDNDPEWECDSIKEAMEWIDGYKEDQKKEGKKSC